MKIIIKTILDLFDYFTQKKIIFILKREFKNNKPLVIFDVGSHKGEYISSIKKNFTINKIFSFEPNKEIFEKLKKKVKNNENIFLFNFGISDKAGNSFLNKNIESSSSSINDLNENSNYYKKKYFFLNFLNLRKVTTKIPIDLKRLDDFILNNKVDSIDLLKIDTEGYELQTLKSLGNKLNQIKFIHFEHHFDDMILKNYKFNEIHKLLIKNGFYKLFKIKMKFRKSFEYIYKNKSFIN